MGFDWWAVIGALCVSMLNVCVVYPCLNICCECVCMCCNFVSPQVYVCLCVVIVCVSTSVYLFVCLIDSLSLSLSWAAIGAFPLDCCDWCVAFAGL